MKTQIIALEAYDDLISVRDRMSWAKSPRILLVWPKFEKISLRAVDLRILQQHASYLGSQMGIITRRGDVRRDAEQFGIPVFGSAAAAQRQAWPQRGPRAPGQHHRPRRSRSELEEMSRAAKPAEAGWQVRPATRVASFALGVLAALAIAAVFLPEATITLAPASQTQDITLPVTASTSVSVVTLAGGLPAHEITVTVSGTQSARVTTRSQVPDQEARGIARFTNLTQSALTIPKGTIVYSLSPAQVQFVTLNETHLPGNVNAVVEVPIASVNGGAQGNLPANAIQAIQGSLGLSAGVTNPQPTTGGTDIVAAAASDADRQRLHDVLLEQLKGQAEEHMRGTVGPGGQLLSATLKMTRVVEEKYAPPPGRPGNLLELTLRADFRAEYVSGDDLTRLVDATLDGAKPQGFSAVPDSLSIIPVGAPSIDDAGVSHFTVRLGRKLVHDVDLSRARALARGRSPDAAVRALEAGLMLEAPPRIRIAPMWWPWTPLVPFRVTVTTTQ